MGKNRLTVRNITETIVKMFIFDDLESDNLLGKDNNHTLVGGYIEDPLLNGGQSNRLSIGRDLGNDSASDSVFPTVDNNLGNDLGSDSVFPTVNDNLGNDSGSDSVFPTVNDNLGNDLGSGSVFPTVDDNLGNDLGLPPIF